MDDRLFDLLFLGTFRPALLGLGSYEARRGGFCLGCGSLACWIELSRRVWSSRLCFGYDPHDTWRGESRPSLRFAMFGLVACCCGQELSGSAVSWLGLKSFVCQIPLELFNMKGAAGD